MHSFMKYKTPAWTAIISSFSSGIAVHLFGLVNVLHNYDDIAQQPRGYGTGITSGRWFLSMLGDAVEWLGGNYNLPLVNGVLFFLLIGVSAGVIIQIFQIKNRKSAALIGILFSVFPSAFSTMVFRYTSVYYGIGILFSILAAWFADKRKFGYLWSALCIALSLGIYQAYVPITIAIFVLLLLKQALAGQSCLSQLILNGLKYCLTLIFGLVLYYILLKIALQIYATELSDYQGMDQMGKIQISRVPQLLKEAFYSVITLPVNNYCGIASTKLSKLLYLFLGFLSGCLIIFRLIQVKNWGTRLFALAMVAVFPIAVNFIVIMCPDSWIYTLMVYSFVLIPCIPFILLELISESDRKKIVERGVSGIVALLICSYAYQTNVNYTALHYSNRQIENYFSSMIAQIRMTEGFQTDMELVMVGDIEDPLLHSYWEYEMTFGGVEFTEWMLKRYSISEWIRNYYGYTFKEPSQATIDHIINSQELEEMECWPNQGSISIIDHAVVIKFQSQ